MFGGMATEDGSIADMLQDTTVVLQIAAVVHLSVLREQSLHFAVTVIDISTRLRAERRF